MSPAHGRAYARAALLGNPSDGYGGRTISFVVRDFAARVTVAATTRPSIEPPEAQTLLRAAVERFRDYFHARGVAIPRSQLSFRWRTTIPREVGLGGSSAIVIAALRALCALHEVSIPAEVLPSLALSVETEGLGIEAGLQDRVAQTYEGLTYMDFEPEALAARGHGRYEQLDSKLLPPLLVAYETQAAEASWRPHGDLRRRYEDRDPGVIAAMDEIAELARRGRECLLAGDHEGLRRVVDRNFDARRRMYRLDPRHVRLVEIARSLGASANYAGSGGAIVAIPRDGNELEAVRSELARHGCGVVVPTIA
jgi:glucuronokinase